MLHTIIAPQKTEYMRTQARKMSRTTLVLYIALAWCVVDTTERIGTNLGRVWGEFALAHYGINVTLLNECANTTSTDGVKPKCLLRCLTEMNKVSKLDVLVLGTITAVAFAADIWCAFVWLCAAVCYCALVIYGLSVLWSGLTHVAIVYIPDMCVPITV